MPLLGLLVFLNGDEIHRPHFVHSLLQIRHLPGHRVPVGGGAAGRHFFRCQGLDFGRSFVGDGDGNALAADLVEVHLILLLNPLAQVLDAHVLLRQFHVERAPLVLQIGQTPPLLA